MSMIHPYLTNGRQSGQSIFEVATTVVGESDAVHPVGTRGALPDGRVFYYARNSGAGAITVGQALSAEVQTAQFTELAVGTPAIGDTTVSPTLGSTAVTLNEYAEGYLCVIDDTGEGYTYKIQSHAAASGTTAVALTIHDPIQVAFGAGATVQVVKNPWADVIQAPGGQVALPVGIAQCAVPAGNTVPQYFWCQTWGVSCALQDEICAVGKANTLGPTAGAVEIADAAGEPLIGINLWTSADGEHAPVFLTIAP